MTITNISGVRGKILIGSTAIDGVGKWSAKLQSNNPKFASSDVPGHKVSVAGVKSGTVSFDLVLNVDAAQYETLKIGEATTLKCYENATRFWIFPVRIESIGEDVDVNDGAEVRIPYEASINGIWTYPSGDESEVT